MTTRLELILRAALCRQFAKREPANQAIWMAEAENWLRLSKEKPWRKQGSKLSVPRRDPRNATCPQGCRSKGGRS
jgi:hypothetical protein